MPQAEPSSAAGEGHEVRRNDGIDTIRDLLRQLEDAAADLPTALHATDSDVSVGAGTGVARAGILPAGILSASGLFANSGVLSGSRSVGWMIGVGSFAFGVAAAAGLLIAVAPFQSTKTPQREIAQAPATGPAAPVIATQPAAGGGIAAPSVAGKDEPSAERVVQITTAPNPPRQPASEPQPSSTSELSPSEPAKPAVAKRVAFALSASEVLEMRPGDRKALDLQLKPMPTDSDAVLVVLRGVPAWLAVSKGSTIGEAIWLLPGHHASDLSLIASENASGSADILIQLAHLDGRILAEQRLSVRAGRASRPTPMVAAVPEAGEQSALRLLARGELLLDTGEIEAARLLLRTAAEGGSVAAALKLAQTYDPAEMQGLGMADASADPTQAVRWYQRAAALGSPAASARISALSAR